MVYETHHLIYRLSKISLWSWCSLFVNKLVCKFQKKEYQLVHFGFQIEIY